MNTAEINHYRLPISRKLLKKKGTTTATKQYLLFFFSLSILRCSPIIGKGYVALSLLIGKYLHKILHLEQDIVSKLC